MPQFCYSVVLVQTTIPANNENYVSSDDFLVYNKCDFGIRWVLTIFPFESSQGNLNFFFIKQRHVKQSNYRLSNSILERFVFHQLSSFKLDGIEIILLSSIPKGVPVIMYRFVTISGISFWGLSMFPGSFREFFW